MNPYDELYSRLDMLNRPFGYSKDYLIWRQAQLKRPLTHIISENRSILDVGGGYGILGDFLPPNKKERYYNLDVSLSMLKLSPYRNILATSEFLPIKDKSFDYVVCSEVLEHVNNKVKTLSECHRVLKPGGFLMLTTPRTGWREEFISNPIFRSINYLSLLLNRPKPNIADPKGVRDEPCNESWLYHTLGMVGFEVLRQYRIDNHVPWSNGGESRFWRWFSDKFVDGRKYGHCTVVVCAK